MDTSTRFSGVVKHFDSQKDYGFIAREDGQRDIFFAGANLLGDHSRQPQKGDHVTFETRRTARGIVAVNVCNQDDPASVAEFDAWNTSARQSAREDHAATQARFEAYFKARRVIR